MIFLSVHYLKSFGGGNFTLIKLQASFENIISNISPTDGLVREKFEYFYRNSDHYEVCVGNFGVIKFSIDLITDFYFEND